MKPKIISILLSLAAAFLLLSGGYGLWEKELTIKGTIEVVDANKFDEGQCDEDRDRDKDDRDYKDDRNDKDDRDRKYTMTSVESSDSKNIVSQNVYE